MEAGWRDEGFDYDTVEVWAVGYPGQESRVDDMAGEDGTQTIMVDTEEEIAWTAFGAHANDIVIIDKRGCLAGRFNTGVDPITSSSNRDALDDLVTPLLSE